MVYKEIGDIIRQRREDLEISQRELAKTLGVSKSTISRWETGQIESMKTWMINMLAAALHMPAGLFFGSGEDVEDAELVKMKIEIVRKVEDMKDPIELKAVRSFISALQSK